MSPRGEGPLPANQSPKEVENKAKPKSKHLNSAQYHHGPSPGDNRRQSNKIGLQVTHLGCGRTPMTVTQVLGRFNVLTRRFASSIRG